jgi:O-antigen ligase/cytochrome c-type biogenesis protein CcmH/NrfG
VKDRIGVVVLAALLPVVFLAVDLDGWYWFGPIKWLAVTVAIPAGAALLFRARPLRVVRRPTVAATALVGCFTLAAVAGIDPLYAWIGTPERHLGVLAWLLCLVALVAGQSLRESDHRVVTVAVAVAGLGVGGVAFGEALGWEPNVLDVGRRLSGSLGSSAYLGAATVLLVPACAGVAADRSVPRRLRTVAGVAVPVLLVAMLGSGARAAWVGLVLAGVVLAVARRHDLAARPRAVAVTAALIAIAVVGLATFSPVGPRVASAFDRDEPGGSGRLDEWRVATRVVLDHPVLGVGPEGYRIAFASGVDEAYERDHGRDPLPDRAHAAPLDILLVGGAPALLTWLAFLAFAGRHVWRALRGARPWLVGTAAGVAAYQLAQLLLFPIGEIEPVVWLLAGVVIGATARPDERMERVLPRVTVPAFASVAVLAAIAGGLDVAADRSAREAVDALAADDPSRAYAAAEHAAALRPDEVRLHLLVGRAAVADGRGTLTALDAVDVALDRSPDDPIARRERASLLVDRARATLVPDHIEEARRAVGELLVHDPDNAQLLLLVGHAARLGGDVRSAEAAWARAEDLAPRSAAPAAALALLYLENDRKDDAAAAADRALAREADDAAALEVRRRVDGAG